MDEIKLPPLPSGFYPTPDHGKCFDRDDMQAYARTAIALDRQGRRDVVPGTEVRALIANMAAFLVASGDPYAEPLINHANELLAQPAEPSGGESVAWEMFPGYLIDHCEGEIITEEGLQRALVDMLADPRYSTQQKEGEPKVPEGFRLIAVNDTFDSLMFWLDRCEQKGHLENCADLVEPWEAFEYREVEAPQPAESVIPKGFRLIAVNGDRVLVDRKDIHLWRAEWMEEHDAGDDVDVVTPFDHYLY